MFLEGPTDRYVQFINKMDRKHRRMLVGLLIGHINLHYTRDVSKVRLHCREINEKVATLLFRSGAGSVLEGRITEPVRNGEIKMLRRSGVIY